MKSCVVVVRVLLCIVWMTAGCATGPEGISPEMKSATTTNANTGWVSTGPPQSFVCGLLINPHDPGTLVIGMDDDGGIYRSTDFGAQPMQVCADFASMNLTATPDFQTIIACDSYGRGLRRSTDGGNTWVRSDTGLEESLAVEDVSISPLDTSLVFAACSREFRGVTRAGGVFKSTDGGLTWSKSGLQGTGAFSVVASPYDRNVVYVAGIGTGIHRSTDGGQTWTVLGLEGKAARDLLLDVADPNRIYAFCVTAGIFYTEDGGKTWQQAQSEVEDTWVWRAGQCTADPNVLYVSTLGAFVAANKTPYGGMLRSNDRGKTWQKCGLENQIVISAAVDPTDPNTVYGGTYGGPFYRSRDGGKSWEPLWDGYRTAYITATPFVDPQDPKTVYAGTHASGPHSVLWKTNDGGESWQPTGAKGLAYNELSGKAVTKWPRENPTLLLLGLKFEAAPEGAQPGLYISRDDGATWEKRLEANIMGLVHAQDGGLFATTQGKGIFKSADALNWEPLGLDGKTLMDLWQDPQDPSHLLACFPGGESSGISVSRDGGVTWSPTAFAAPSCFEVTHDPRHPGRLYAAGGSLYRSEDNGATWTEIRKSEGFVSSVLVHPEKAGVLYYAAAGYLAPFADRGVWRSEDDGATWARLTEGVITQEFGSGGGGSVVMGSDGTLWAGTVANGLWRYPE